MGVVIWGWLPLAFWLSGRSMWWWLGWLVAGWVLVWSDEGVASGPR